MKLLICLILSLTVITANADTKTEATPAKQSTKVKVPRGKYITGGVLGSAVGYGIGHAVQGRYSSSNAWVFTAGEAAGTTLMLVGLADVCRNGDCSSSRTGWSTLGLGIFLGFHIWEIIDVWTTAEPVDDGPSAMLLPNGDSGAQLVVGFRF